MVTLPSRASAVTEKEEALPVLPIFIFLCPLAPTESRISFTFCLVIFEVVLDGIQSIRGVYFPCSMLPLALQYRSLMSRISLEMVLTSAGSSVTPCADESSTSSLATSSSMPSMLR